MLTNLQICLATIDLDFSHKRGYHTAPFNLIIEADDPNAVIRYTVDNTKPTDNNGNIYNGPINISSSTALRVFAYSANDISNTRTHSYIFLSDIINSNYMYNYITQDATYGPLMESSFEALPVISLISNQINRTNHIDTEIETSVEMFFPDASRSGFMVHSGIQTWGGSATNPKKHYRLEFKEIYGTSKLDYKIFKTDNYDNTIYNIPPAEKFNKLLLRGGSQDALNAEYGAENLAQYVRNRYFMDTQMEMGYPAPHGRFVHVFVNLEYVGQYHLMERPDVDFFESYYGGAETDYEVYKSGEYWDDLNLNLWDNLESNVNLNTLSNMQNTRRYLDLEQTAAYLNIMSYGSGFDWAEAHNCLGGTNIMPGSGGYKFIVWDMDFNFGNGGKWNPSGTSLTYFNAPLVQDGPVPDNLVGNVEFKYILADHLECNCYNNGLLTPNVVDSLYMHRINQVTTSLIAESARWGDYNFTYSNGHIPDATWDVNNEFMKELNRIKTSWIPQRTNSMINYYENNDLKSDLDAVDFNVYGGKVNQNFTLNLTNNNSSSEIYYTLDGTDPRAFAGGIANNAIQYSGPVSLPAGPVTVKARVRDSNHSNGSIRKWSAMCPRTFYVNQNYEDLVINEIHYNPKDSIFYNTFTATTDTVSGKSFEFVELKNTGDDVIYMQDVSFSKGIAITFEAPLVILPDSFIVIAEDAYWFEQKYGFQPNAVYTGKLENSGETLSLQAPCKSLIDSVKYDDTLPWDTVPDNGIYALALIDDLADNALPSNWSSQITAATPGSSNLFCTPFTVSNEIFDVSCNGMNDGIINITTTGGTPPFTFAWNNGDTNQNLSAIAEGNYSVTITDKFGCDKTENYTISEPPLLTSNIIATGETYFQANDGTASITVAGGVPPYNYLWSNNAVTSSINNLAPGDYSLQITDNNGCILNETVTITAIDCSQFDLQITATDQTYYQSNDGTASVNVLNGTAPYAYLWSTTDITSSISNLAPGTYDIDVTDNLGCSLSAPLKINAVDCSSLSAQLSNTNETSYQANNGTVSVSVNGGLTPYTYNWSTGASVTSLNNLNPGTYKIEITDAIGCPLIDSISVLPYTCDSIDVGVRAINESCFGKGDGMLIINSIQNGTLPYTITWSTGISGTVNNNLVTGSYSLQITDSKNCPFYQTYAVIAQSNITTSYLVENESASNANDGMIDLSVTGGVAPYTYTWNNGKFTEDINNLVAGTYNVNIKDKLNCTADVIDIKVGVNSSDCPANLVEVDSPAVNTMQIQVEQYIQTNAYIDNGNVVSYTAGDYIELKDNFEVKQGSEFEAMIEDCY